MRRDRALRRPCRHHSYPRNAVGAAGVAALAPFIGVTLLCSSVAAVAGATALWAYGARVLARAPMTIGATSLLGAAGGLVATVLLAEPC